MDDADGVNSEMCGGCEKRPALPTHPCPYRYELSAEESDHCNCCDDCMYQCAMDI
jgi:hypothetical protein